MQSLKLIVTGVILGAAVTWGAFYYSLNHNSPAVPVMGSVQNLQSPLTVIYDFYLALDKGSENELLQLLTPGFASEINQNSIINSIKKRKQEDPSLQFLFFLVTEEYLDPSGNRVRVQGRSEWKSAASNPISIPQVVTLMYQHAQWQIESIDKP